MTNKIKKNNKTECVKYLTNDGEIYTLYYNEKQKKNHMV